MPFESSVGVIGAAGGDAITLLGSFNTSSTYQVNLVGTDDSIGPVMSADTQLQAGVAAGFSGALPVGGIELYYFPTSGRLVIDPHTPNAEAVGYTKSGNAIVLTTPLVLAHAGGADVRTVVAGLDGVPPFSVPMFSGISGSPQVCAPLSATTMVVYAPALSFADTVAYEFFRHITVNTSEQQVAGPATSTQTTRTFCIQTTSLLDGTTDQSTNTLVLAAPYLPASVYDMRRYLANYAVGSRSADQEGAIWGQ